MIQKNPWKSDSFIPNIALFIVLVLIFSKSVFAADERLPYEIVNNSRFSDDQVYVALVGITDGHVWLDAKTNEVKPMSLSDNTVSGPVYGGNYGPGTNGLYADCFTKLSEIPNKTLQVPKIAGTRILIAFESQLYMYFFGHSGAPSGYAAPNLTNPTDPNQGIRFEMIELTWNEYGLWTNTTRVDSYQLPMNLEVWGEGNYYKRVGELLSHDSLISRWKSTVPAEFQACLNDEDEVIHAPSKIPEFQAGGAQENYFQGYIDAIWQKYRTEDLTFFSGDAGTWQGRVGDDGRFVFHNLTNMHGNATAIISAKPNTQEAFEGKGVLAENVQNLPTQTLDLVVQAQFCAALNRHAIDLNAPVGATQDWSDTSKYFKVAPFNEYVKFWHAEGVRYERFAYGFCYDDVFEQSSTVHTPTPTRVKVTLGVQEVVSPLSPSVSQGVANTSVRAALVGSTLRFSGAVPAKAHLKIYSLQGRVLHSQDISYAIGALPTNLARGNYIWSLSWGEVQHGGVFRMQ